MPYGVWDRNGDMVLVKKDPLGIAEWITLAEYNALVAAEESLEDRIVIGDEEAKPVTQESKRKVRSIEDDGAPRA